MCALYWNRLKVILGITIGSCAYACESSKMAIDESAIYVTNQAGQAKMIATDISKTTQEPDTANKADKIVGHQDNIIESASDIRTSLHGVEDTIPWWAQLFNRGFVAIAIAGVIILLWQTGIGMFIKKIFWSMGLFIPKRALRSAEVDLKTQRHEHPLSFEEGVAVRRTSDPAYEYARKRKKKELGV